MAVKKAISIRKAELMEQSAINCEGDQKKLFSIIHSLFGSKKITVLPEYNNNNNNNNCLKSNIQCIEIRVQWTVHLGS